MEGCGCLENLWEELSETASICGCRWIMRPPSPVRPVPFQSRSADSHAQPPPALEWHGSLPRVIHPVPDGCYRPFESRRTV